MSRYVAPPALARASIDRAAAERATEGLLAALITDPGTRVLTVTADQIATEDDVLAWSDTTHTSSHARWAFLGRDAEGTALVVAALPSGSAPPEGAVWSALRVVGGALSAIESALAIEAVSLGRWLWDASFCPACGTAVELRQAGWSRSCPGCGREHFPRTDPAVIVAITDAADERLLLGKNALWASRNMYSAFAGFVEAGESLEATIARELLEECGVHVDDVRYHSSQSWPYPRSLMLGFHAVATDPAAARGDGEEIVDVRWFTRPQLREALAGDSEVTLPGHASIAHTLIRDWVERA